MPSSSVYSMSEALLRQSQIEIIEQINAANFANSINSAVSCTTSIYFSSPIWASNVSAIDTTLADGTICIFLSCPNKPLAIYGFDKTSITPSDVIVNTNIVSKYNVLSSAWTYLSCFYIYDGSAYDLFNNGALLLSSHRYYQVSCNDNTYGYMPATSSDSAYYFFNIA